MMQILQFFTRGYWPLLTVSLLAATVSYGDSWMSLNDRWNSRGEAYSHGYLLLLVALWFVWRQRAAIHLARPHPSWLALFLLLGTTTFWLLGRIIDVRIAQQLVLPALPLLALAATLGWRAAYPLLFPCLLLYTVIPVWDVLIPHLQALTVTMSGTLLKFFEIPAHITGHYIQLPAGTLQVAAGCAGLSYLLIGITLGMIYAQHFTRQWHHRTVLVLMGALTGLVANWIRVFGIALIAHQSEMKSSMVKDHEFFGWVVFAVCLVPFFLLAYWLEDSAAPAAATEKPLEIKPALTKRVLTAFSLTTTVALLGPLTALWLQSRTPLAVEFELPETLNGAPSILPVTSWTPAFQGAEIQTRRTYFIGGRQVTAVVMIYPHQAQGAELVSWNNTLADGKEWTQVYETRQSPFIVSEIQHASKEQLLKERLLVYAWYDVGGKQSNQPTQAKLLQLQAVSAGRQDASLFAIALSCKHSPCETPDENLMNWLNESHEMLATMLKVHAADAITP